VTETDGRSKDWTATQVVGREGGRNGVQRVPGVAVTQRPARGEAPVGVTRRVNKPNADAHLNLRVRPKRHETSKEPACLEASRKGRPRDELTITIQSYASPRSSGRHPPTGVCGRQGRGRREVPPRGGTGQNALRGRSHDRPGDPRVDVVEGPHRRVLSRGQRRTTRSSNTTKARVELAADCIHVTR